MEKKMTLVEFVTNFDELVTPELWEQCVKETEAREDKIEKELKDGA